MGDLSCAEISFCLELPPALPREPTDCPFLCLRCLSVSSLCNLMRIDLLEGLISSEVCDFERELRRPDPALAFSPRSWSDSDSLDRPEDEDPDENTGRLAIALPLPIFMVSLGVVPPLFFSLEAAFRSLLRFAPKSLRKGSRGEKLPSSS